MPRPVVLALAALLCASCAKGTPQNPIFPAGVSPTPLPQPPYVGLGRYYKLAEMTTGQNFGGIPFVSFVEVRQSSDSTVVQPDFGGFVFAQKGPHDIFWGEDVERRKTWDEGKADWVNPKVSHVNLTSSETIWDLVTVRSIAERNSPPSLAGARSVYSSPDLPPAPAGKLLVHQLALITMDPGGRTSAHSHGGVEVFYVIKGTVELAVNNGTRTNVAAGQGASIRPGLIMQLHVLGNEAVEILTYFVTPEGEPWQTNVQTLP